MVEVSHTPKTLIVESHDLLSMYIKESQDLVNPSDLPELVTQVIQVMLNASPPYREQFLELPEFERIIGGELYVTQVKLIIKVATLKFAHRLYERLVQYKVFKEDGDGSLDYGFEKLLGYDIVLFHLPH